MKKQTTLTLLLCCIALTSLAQARIVENLNFGWKFHLGDVANATQVSFDDSQWRTVNVPHDFQVEQPWVAPASDEKADNSDLASNVRSRLSARGFKEMGIGWYRYHFTPSTNLRGKRILLDFQGILLVGDVYLNGKHIGNTEYGYLGFDIDITGQLKWNETNIIAVKANTQQPNNSRWYTGAGLYRDVRIIATDSKQYFARHALYITTPDVASDKATVNIQAAMTCMLKTNNMRVHLRISDDEGKEVLNKELTLPYNRKMRTTEMKIGRFTLANPKLWSCEQPHLYTLHLAYLREDGSVADEITEQFGVRKIEYSPLFGLKLNGKKVLLKGIANHHTLGALGAAAYPRAIEKRLQLLKQFGFNHVRTSHNPYSEDFLKLCDKYGILVVDELYDKWLTQFTGGRTEWMNQWQHDIPEFIKRDRNHPSVVMWSLGNELQTYANLPFEDWGVTPYRMQKPLLLRYDNTRPITVAMHPRGRNLETDSLPADLALETDIAAYNYRYMYFPGDSKRYPNMIFYQSEANNAMMGPNFFEMNLDKVVGLAYWGMIDYLGESNGWPAKGWAQGAFDIGLEPKPVAYLLKSMFMPDVPTVHIGVIDDESNVGRVWNDVVVGTSKMSENWNRREGSKVNLWTYTNCDEVELFLNGKSLGVKKNSANAKDRNRIYWTNVPYEAGVLRAVGRNGGKEVTQHKIETAGNAVKLIVEPDNIHWAADGIDLQHVRIMAVDKKGNRVFNADNNLKFDISGDADIVGVVSGNITSDELMVGKERRLFQGVATVIIRAGRKADKIKFTVTPDGMKPITKTFVTR